MKYIIVIRNSHSHNTGRIVDIFIRTWNIWGDFEAVLATFCCCDQGGNASEAVQKIVTDQKDYQKCSSCVIVWWIAKTYQSITVKKGWLLGHLRRSIVVKKVAEVVQKKEQ